MSLVLLNPSCLHGEPGDPPEYVSNAPVTCARCSVELDAEDDSVHKAVVQVEFGRLLSRPRYEQVCADCIACCPCCGEYMDAASAETLGPEVSVRLWEHDGRREVHHALCAADWLLSCWNDEPGLFESARASREEIVAIVAGAFPAAASRVATLAVLDSPTGLPIPAGLANADHSIASTSLAIPSSLAASANSTDPAIVSKSRNSLATQLLDLSLSTLDQPQGDAMTHDEQTPMAELAGIGRLRGYIDRIARFVSGENRSFGFVVAEDGKEYFLHRRSVRPVSEFREGVRLEFSVTDAMKPGQKQIAVRVEVVG